MKIVTASEMREIERRASTEFGISEHDLMEAAAHSMLRALANEIKPEHVAVVCGPGNNGGDGLTLARKLAEAGRDVRVLLSVSPSSLKGEALAQYRHTLESGVTIASPTEREYKDTLASADQFDTVIDCLLGTGAKGAPHGEIAKLIEWINEAPAYVMSADLPSGIDCDTGLAEGVFVDAISTVTFGLPKPFLFQGQGIEASGEWSVGEIGLPDKLTRTIGHIELLEREWFFDHVPNRPRSAHKRSAGVVLVIAGSDSYPGAAALTARGAYRAGAGFVSVASVRFVLEGIRAHLPECPLVHLPSSDGAIDVSAAPIAIAAAENCDGVCIGPGLGRSEATKEFLAAVLPALKNPVVLDGDALYFVAEGLSVPHNAIITPHEGEAARLLRTTSEEIGARRFHSAARLSENYACTVLLKGTYSLIAHEGKLFVNPTGDQLLATAGSGDVLTGIIGAMLAMKYEPRTAALLAAYWHGLSARSLRPSHPGGAGALASEIADNLSAARSAEFDSFVNEMMGGEDWEEDEEYEEFDEEDFDENDN